VHDVVARGGEEVRLTVETRGEVFNRGGELVEFFVDGKSFGKKLSGGDGFAFREFTPHRTGIYRVSARSGGEEASGLLLTLPQGRKILFVDVEGALLEGGPFSGKTRDGSQNTLKEMSRRFPVLFLQTGVMGESAVKDWLKKNGFIDAPVLAWSNGAVLDEILEKGLGIKAIVGGSGVVESAKEYKATAFTFQETEGAIEVKDWEEIRKKLK